MKASINFGGNDQEYLAAITLNTCPERSTPLEYGQSCQDFFHKMLFWENEYPNHGAVHHLMVLCYYIQHPGLYSAEGLREAQRLLTGFLEGSVTPFEARKHVRARVDSGRRNWKIKGTAPSRGAYAHPADCMMTAREGIIGGPGNYYDNVREWAISTQQALKDSGN